MNAKEAKSKSKFLSLILRHQPELVHIKLEREGWVGVQKLLDNIQRHKPSKALSFEELKYVVKTNDKQRFGFNAEKSKIRANQGHSTKVEMNYTPNSPPAFLYHGTALKNVESILEKGILKGTRQYVHLSKDKETALRVGTRHGKPHIFKVEALKMIEEGHYFYQADNGVWLTEFVPSVFLK